MFYFNLMLDKVQIGYIADKAITDNTNTTSKNKPASITFTFNIMSSFSSIFNMSKFPAKLIKIS